MHLCVALWGRGGGSGPTSATSDHQPDNPSLLYHARSSIRLCQNGDPLSKLSDTNASIHCAQLLGISERPARSPPNSHASTGQILKMPRVLVALERTHGFVVDYASICCIISAGSMRRPSVTDDDVKTGAHSATFVSSCRRIIVCCFTDQAPIPRRPILRVGAI